MKRFVLIIYTVGWLLAGYGITAVAGNYPVRGKVVDKQSRQPIAYANVLLVGQPGIGAATDSAGIFLIEKVRPGIYRLSASCIGYKEVITPEYSISATTPFIEIEMEEDGKLLGEITVRPSPFRRTPESPVSLQVIGLQEIEKSPGANRDVSRIVRSYPGVSFSPIGYRNDLIVRGGSPSENRFYMDGIEIPNINHFATQGAPGGPVSLINADLIREINFYMGAFPVNRAGALSSVLDIRLRDGNKDRNTYKATVGASEVSFSGSGHIGSKTTFLFSVRQSYLQLLFKLLGLPFLPNYIDGQFKVKTQFSPRNEIILLGLTGIDHMKLNTSETGEEAEYLLSYLPTIRQKTFTFGAAYKHYAGVHVQTVSAGHTYLNNKNVKYRNNDDSSEENLTSRLRSVEQKTSLRAENRTSLDVWTFQEGLEATYSQYTIDSYQRLYTDAGKVDDYRSVLGILGWGAFASAQYVSPGRRLTLSAGLRADGCNYSSRMSRFWRYLSPRASVSYAFTPAWTVSGSSGLYHQLPPYTALGYKNGWGERINQALDYMRVAESSIGIEWKHKDRLAVSLEGFYKRYKRMPLSVNDGIPLACKGDDYGVVGNEELISTASGRAYGVEAMFRWQIPGKLNLVSAFTLYRSEFRNNDNSSYIASSWDNRFILNVSGTYNLPHQWSVGAKLSYIGGAPYTPYDIEKSSLVGAWDVQGRPYYDYALYHTGRLDNFAQLDIRVDKNFYYRRCMFGIYIDIQNITGSKLVQPDVLLSTGEILNPEAPAQEQRYRMKYIGQKSGTLIPTLGMTIEF